MTDHEIPTLNLAEDRFVAEAGREKGHKEALTVLKRLYDEGDCLCRACLRFELEALRAL